MWFHCLKRPCDIGVMFTTAILSGSWVTILLSCLMVLSTLGIVPWLSSFPMPESCHGSVMRSTPTWVLCCEASTVKVFGVQTTQSWGVSHQTSKIFLLLEFVSWDDCSQYMESHKIPCSSHHQPDRFRFNPLTSSLLVRYIMLYILYLSVSPHNQPPTSQRYLDSTIDFPFGKLPSEASGFLGSFCHVSYDC